MIFELKQLYFLEMTERHEAASTSEQDSHLMVYVCAPSMESAMEARDQGIKPGCERRIDRVTRVSEIHVAVGRLQ